MSVCQLRTSIALFRYLFIHFGNTNCVSTNQLYTCVFKSIYEMYTNTKYTTFVNICIFEYLNIFVHTNIQYLYKFVYFIIQIYISKFILVYTIFLYFIFLYLYTYIFAYNCNNKWMRVGIWCIHPVFWHLGKPDFFSNTFTLLHFYNTLASCCDYLTH